MTVSGTQLFPGTPATLWPLLRTPEVVAVSLPGSPRLTIHDASHFEATLPLRIGPFSESFVTTFRITDEVPPHAYRLHVTASGPGGHLKGYADIRLEAVSSGTMLHYDSTVEVGGALRSLGRLVLQRVCRLATRQHVHDLAEEVTRRLSSSTQGPHHA